MRGWNVPVSLLAVLALAGSASAQCGKEKVAKGEQATMKTVGGESCHKDRSGLAGQSDGCSAKGKAAQQALAADTPTLHYKVGDKTTCCPKEAEKLAEADEGQIRFVLGEKEFASRSEAMSAWQAALEQYLARLQTVRYAVGDQCVACPTAAQTLAKESGGKVKFRVASYAFAERDKAEAAAKAAQEVAEKVQLTCVVDGQKYTCEKEAGQACEKTGKKCEFLVGQTKTSCPVSAKVELAKARIEAALKVIAEYAGA